MGSLLRAIRDMPTPQVDPAASTHNPCFGKIKRTREGAERHAARLGRRGEVKAAIEPYRCDVCGHWHVGGRFYSKKT